MKRGVFSSAGRTFRPTNGRAGMVYSVRQDLSLYGQYATATDAVRDPDDRMPAVIDAASWVQHFAKHPRSFVRDFVLNR